MSRHEREEVVCIFNHRTALFNNGLQSAILFICFPSLLSDASSIGVDVNA